MHLIASVLALTMGMMASVGLARNGENIVVLFDKHDFMLPTIMKQLESLKDSSSAQPLFNKVTCLNNLVSQMNTEITVADVFSYFGALRAPGLERAGDSLYKAVAEPLWTADLMLRVTENVVHDRLEFQFFLYRVGSTDGAGPFIQLDAPEYYNGWFMELESADIKARVLSEFAHMFPVAFPLPRFDIIVNGGIATVHFVAVGDSVEVLAQEQDPGSARWYANNELRWRREVLLESGGNDLAELFISGKRCKMISRSEQDVRLNLHVEDGIHPPADWSVVLRFRKPTVLEVAPDVARFFTRPPLWGRTPRVRMPIVLKKDTRIADSSATVTWSYGSAYGAYSSDTMARKPLKPVTKYFPRGSMIKPLYGQDPDIPVFQGGAERSEVPYLIVMNRAIGISEVKYEMLFEPDVPMNGALRVELNENGRVKAADLHLQNVELSPLTFRIEHLGTLYRLRSDTISPPDYVLGLGGLRAGFNVRILGPFSVALSAGVNGAKARDVAFDATYYEFGIAVHSIGRKRTLSDISYGLCSRWYNFSYVDSIQPTGKVDSQRRTALEIGVGLDMRSMPFEFLYDTPCVATFRIGYCPVSLRMGNSLLIGSLEVGVGLEFDGYPLRHRARSSGAHREKESWWNEAMGYPRPSIRSARDNDKVPPRTF